MSIMVGISMRYGAGFGVAIAEVEGAIPIGPGLVDRRAGRRRSYSKREPRDALNRLKADMGSYHRPIPAGAGTGGRQHDQ